MAAAPQRITMVNKYYPPHIGGVEFHVRDIAEGLVEHAGAAGARDRVQRRELAARRDGERRRRRAPAARVRARVHPGVVELHARAARRGASRPRARPLPLPLPVPLGRAGVASRQARRAARGLVPQRHRAPEARARRVPALPRALPGQRRPHHGVLAQPHRALRVPLGACREVPPRRLRPAGWTASPATSGR